jgi:hypothetical protein
MEAEFGYHRVFTEECFKSCCNEMVVLAVYINDNYVLEFPDFASSSVQG